jgi:hypothetical protein
LALLQQPELDLQLLTELSPQVDCSRFGVVRPVFEATLQEFGVSQKVIAQPHIYLGMWPAWLRKTSWACSLVSDKLPCPPSYWRLLFGGRLKQH